jgi:hypothetical protein
MNEGESEWQREKEGYKKEDIDSLAELAWSWWTLFQDSGRSLTGKFRVLPL